MSTKAQASEQVRRGENDCGMVETGNARSEQRVVARAVGRADVEPQRFADRRAFRRRSYFFNCSCEARSTHSKTFGCGSVPLTKAFKPGGVNATAKEQGYRAFTYFYSGRKSGTER